MRKLAFIHPILWALIPTLALYRANIGELSLDLLSIPLLVSTGCTMLLWFICARVLRLDAHRAAFLTSFILIMVFSYGHIYHLTADFTAIVPYWRFIGLGIWLALLLIGLAILSRLKVKHQVITDWFFAGALIIFVFHLSHIGWYEAARLRVAAQVKTKRLRTAGYVDRSQLPDIYYLILDSYPNNATMTRVFKQKNDQFLDALAQHGFYVAKQSRANYCQTFLSLASSLNFMYLDTVAVTVGAKSSNKQALRSLIQQNRACTMLRKYGYQIVTFPSSYEPVHFPADREFLAKRDSSDFNTVLINTTPLLVLSLSTVNTSFDLYAAHRDTILWQYKHIPDSNAINGPKFVFMHILAPHQPLVFDAVGNPVKADPYTAVKSGRHWRHRTDSRAVYNRKFADEVTYLNTRTLEIIDGIQEHASRPTVIILQGDHGPGYLPDHEPDLAGISIPERFGILNAYYFSDGDISRLYPTISPVNTFRVIFNTYFGTAYPMKDDLSYFSPFMRPYHFLDVTDATRYGEGAEMQADAATRARIRAYLYQ
jgi:hypothetical protein